MSDRLSQLLNMPLIVINIGVDKFAKNLEDQNVEVLHVDWRPPAGRRPGNDRAFGWGP